MAWSQVCPCSPRIHFDKRSQHLWWTRHSPPSLHGNRTGTASAIQSLWATWCSSDTIEKTTIAIFSKVFHSLFFAILAAIASATSDSLFISALSSLVCWPFCGKNSATTPSLSYKIILEHQEKEINWILERNNWQSALVHFGNEIARICKKSAKLSFKFQSILTQSTCGQRHSSISLNKDNLLEFLI